MEIGDGTARYLSMGTEQRLKQFCKERREKYTEPCKGCKFRHHEKKQTCIFANVPRDWD